MCAILKLASPSRKLEYYREVLTDRIRDADVDVVLNLTAGMGGDIIFGGTESPFPRCRGTDMIGAAERVEHVWNVCRNLHAGLWDYEFRRG